jgi:two-component system NarL family response regulator
MKELVETSGRVDGRAPAASSPVAQRVTEHRVGDSLTERELEVLSSVAAGNSNKVVADQLAISEETVKSHMRNIRSKLGANDRTHAVTMAIKRGLISV